MNRRTAGHLLMSVAILWMSMSFLLLAGEVRPESDMSLGAFLGWKLLGAASMTLAVFAAKAIFRRYPELDE